MMAKDLPLAETSTPLGASQVPSHWITLAQTPSSQWSSQSISSRHGSPTVTDQQRRVAPAAPRIAQRLPRPHAPWPHR
jgi:hypothetical protein